MSVMKEERPLGAAHEPEKLICEICYEEYESMDDFFTLKCGHSYCKACVTDHLSSNITEGSVVRIACLDYTCETQFEEDDIRRACDHELFERYARYKLNIEVDMDPNKRWCPRPGCTHYVERVPGTDFVYCQCGHRICMSCGEAAHPGLRCGQTEDDLFQEWKREADGKDCPQCGMVIIKN